MTFSQLLTNEERAKKYYQSVKMLEGNKIFNVIGELLSNGMLLR
jgi:hypothetical protein